MKKLFFIFSFILFFGCSKGQTSGYLKAIQVHDSIQFLGKTVVFIGNSITLGAVGVSPQSNRWSSVFSRAKQDTEVNMGINSQYLQTTGSCGNMPLFDKTTIPTYTNQAALFFALGINDITFNTPAMNATAFKATLDSAIGYAVTTKGWPSKRIILVTPYWISSYTGWNGIGCGHVQADTTRHQTYVAAIISEAAIKQTQIADIYTAMNNSASKGTFLSGDGVHPNNTGAAFIAAFFAGIIFYIN